MTLQVENVCSTDVDMTYLYLDADISDATMFMLFSVQGVGLK